MAFSGLLAAFGLRESLLAIPATGQNQQPRWQHCSAKKTSAGIKKKIKPVVGGPASALELAVAGLAACSCFLLFPLGWPAKKKLRRQSGSRNWIHIWYNMMPKQQHCMSRKQCWALHRPCSHWHIGLGWPGRSCLPCSLLVLLLLVVLHPLQVAFLQLAHLALQVLHLFSLLSFFFSFFLSFLEPFEPAAPHSS